MGRIAFVTLSLGILLVGCPSESPKSKPPRTSSPQPGTASKIAQGQNQLIETFLQAPSEEKFVAIVEAGRQSENQELQAAYFYNEMSKKMRPVDDPTVNLPEVRAALRKVKPDGFRLIEQVMLAHPDQWRRWTIAKVLGEFGGKESIPALKKLLGDKDEGVRKYAEEAIQTLGQN